MTNAESNRLLFSDLSIINQKTLNESLKPFMVDISTHNCKLCAGYDDCKSIASQNDEVVVKCIYYGKFVEELKNTTTG